MAQRAREILNLEVYKMRQSWTTSLKFHGEIEENYENINKIAEVRNIRRATRLATTLSQNIGTCVLNKKQVTTFILA
jgi:hypothetical protein